METKETVKCAFCTESVAIEEAVLLGTNKDDKECYACKKCYDLDSDEE